MAIVHFEPTPDELAALDQANDGVTAVIRSTGLMGERASKWAVVLRTPRRAEWKRFVQTKEKDLHSAVETIFKAVCVYPPKERIEELLDGTGCAGIPFACLDAIAELNGVQGSSELGK